MEAVSRLHLTVTRAYKVNTNINFEVFIHKVDGLSDDHKIQKQRHINKRANDDLIDAGLQSIHLRSGSPPPPIGYLLSGYLCAASHLTQFVSL